MDRERKRAGSLTRRRSQTGTWNSYIVKGRTQDGTVFSRDPLNVKNIHAKNVCEGGREGRMRAGTGSRGRRQAGEEDAAGRRTGGTTEPRRRNHDDGLLHQLLFLG
jgi:hypothetical protein